VFGHHREGLLMAFDLPPIAKVAERLLLEIETAVRHFPRYHKYTFGSDLRRQAMNVARLTHRAWRDRKGQDQWISKLAFAIDDLKLSLQLGKQIEAFTSFRQFEMLARIAADLGRQCGGWLKQRQLNGQNGSTESTSTQRPKTLSARAASPEAIP